MVIPDDEDVRRLSAVQNAIRIASIGDGDKLKLELQAGNIEKTFTTAGMMETKIYKRRWLQLVLLFFYGAVNSLQWVQFTIIGNIISRYYGVSSLAVDWTSITFNVSYIVLVFPASYVMDRVDMRCTCLIGAIGTMIGAWIKFFSVSPDGFVTVLIGQTVVAASQIFVLNVPPRLSANWFGSKQVATATAIGYAGNLTGISLFCLITPMLVKNHEIIEDIGKELSRLFLVVATVCTVVTVALFLFLQDEPRLPPSKARAFQITNRDSGSGSGVFWSKFRRILSNRSFLMLWNSYGMSLGYLNAVSTLLNPLFLAHFQNGETDAGKLGLLMNFPGNFGSIIFALILDKTKKFKALSIFIYVFTIIGEILFAVGLVMEIKWLIFLSVVVIGIFAISHASIGFELSTEVIYPESEEISSGLLNLAGHVYGSILALIAGSLLRTYGDTAAHLCLTGTLASGLIISLFTKIELRRQNARGDAHYGRVASVEVVESDRIGKNNRTGFTPD